MTRLTTALAASAILALSLGLPPVQAQSGAPGPLAAADSAVLAPRLVPLQGVQNFRDVGGYRTVDGRRVKWGLIYRSAELSHVTASDRQALATLDIRHVHDLRSTSERRAEPTAWTGPGAPPVVAIDYEFDRAVMAALFEGEPTPERARDFMAGFYPTLLDLQRPQETGLFDDLLQADGATLYHCTAGKDRTGLATAMLLSALGVPRETILYDYELSNRYFTGGIATEDGAPNQAAAVQGGLPPEVGAVLMQVDARYLKAVFDRIDQGYGSVEAYLDQRLGVDAADIIRLRALYTE